jgi:hypothetical protein
MNIPVWILYCAGIAIMVALSTCAVALIVGTAHIRREIKEFDGEQERMRARMRKGARRT